MTVVVIGASGTIGEACAQVITGSHVVALDLRSPQIEGVTCGTIDVTDIAGVRATLRDIDQATPISGVIYAAGVNTTGYLTDIAWSDYDKVMAVNLQGAFHVGAVIEEFLREQPRPLGMVFLSSTAGLTGEAGGTVYCASKFGLLGFVQSFAAEIAPLGGRANSVCPGNVDSPMLTQLAAALADRHDTTQAAVLAELANGCAFGRLITPAEVAQTCAWLVSPQASGISGQTIVVDGPPSP
jgi:NAD(P)-dependent dehydrogenase (short-subunit alcohol dehydrogenase family)